MTNKPEPMAGAGLSGPRNVALAPADRNKRRLAAMNLVAAGLSDDEILEALQTEFNILPQDAEAILLTALQKLQAESMAREPYKKAMAERRIVRHIASAAKRQAWGPVAQLESTLARIQGTETAQQTHITIDAQMQAALTAVLGNISSEELNELISSELKRLPRSSQ